MIARFPLLLLLALGSIPTHAEVTAITGARVHTLGDAGTLDNATVLFEDGRITAVGTNVSVPPGATRIDGKGKIVTPGLFSPLGQIGLLEVSAVTGSVDYIQRGTEYSASFDVADAFNPRSTLIPVNRIEGITRAATLPAASYPDEMGNVSGILSGLGAIVQLGDGEPHVVRHKAAMVVYLGESGGSVAGGSRAAAFLQFRTALDDALDYAEHRREFDSNQWRKYSVSRADLEALQDVVSGDIPVLVHVERASDISALLELAKQYELHVVIAGGTEAWMVADELAASGTPVILDATANLPDDFDRLNARLDAAALLDAAGVRIAFGADSNAQNHNARNITQAAGIAVAYGLSPEVALRAITLTPAEFYGVADSCGSIERGKDADLVLWNDDPLELTSYPDAVYIRGEAVPMRSRQTLLRDRYLSSGAGKPPAFRHPDN